MKLNENINALKEIYSYTLPLIYKVNFTLPVSKYTLVTFIFIITLFNLSAQVGNIGRKIDCNNFLVDWNGIYQSADNLPSPTLKEIRKKGIAGFPFPSKLLKIENGWVSINVSASRRRAFGLSTTINNNIALKAFNYGFFIEDFSSKATIVEKGARLNSIKIKVGDELSVKKSDGKIIYEHNGKNIRTIQFKQLEELKAKVWLVNKESSFQKFSMSFCKDEFPTPIAKCGKTEPLIFETLQRVEIIKGQIRGKYNLQGFFQTKNRLKPNEDGWICFNVNKSRRKAIGFSAATDNFKNKIEYGILFKNYTTTAQIIESGKIKKTIKIKENDQFKIERQGDFILYFHNGIRLRKIRTDVSRRLAITGWVMTSGGFFDIDDITTDIGEGMQTPPVVCNGENVIYTDLENSVVTGTTIQFQYNDYEIGGFASINEIPAGENGYMCFRYNQSNNNKGIGLSYENEDIHIYTTDYSFDFSSGKIKENQENFIAFNALEGDVFKIERNGNNLLYYHNETIIKTSVVDLNKRLIVDGFFKGFNSFIDVKMSHALPPYCDTEILPDTLVNYCEGDEIQLSIIPDNLFYKWVPSNGLSCSDCPNPIISETFGTVANYYNVNLYYSIEDLELNNRCGRNHVRINQIENCEDEIIGCCFSNYGASITVNQGTYVNVHCNLLNEVGMTNNVLQKGEFENKGNIRVLLDWINNGYNDLFISQKGVSELFGNYQKMRGNSSTHYFDLILSGSDKKEIKIDEYAHGVLDLTDRELVIGDFVFYVENESSGAIQQSTGFASTDGIGYLSRKFNAGTSYHFPLGSTNSTFRIRPIELYGSYITGRYMVGFINHAPAQDGLINIAPNVLSINNLYYHRIKAPSSPINMGIRSFFNKPLEGDFQSLAHLETIDGLNLPFWESTPVATVYPPNASGLDFLETTGAHDFQGEPYVLAQSGFFINTDNFGNDDDPDSSPPIITINPIGNNDASGGGLGEPNSAGGGNTTIAPSPPQGDFEIDILTDDETAQGDITFTVDGDGTIDETSITYVDEETGESGELSPDVFDIDETGTGIILNDTPPSLDFDCASSIIVKMGNNTPLVLNTSESILLEGLPADEINTIVFEIFDQSQNSVIPPQTFTVNIPNKTIDAAQLNNLVEGPHYFKMTISPFGGGGSEIIEGQFIVKP